VIEALDPFQKLKPGDAAISAVIWGELLYKGSLPGNHAGN